ncbi:hypothetical protein R1sor_004161 [Riccia sorocarpa]|uniref:EamA domain-containing protein n=1 Tax=Riccia sorocarpa TaxID=122646 RepID=A0ABD3H7L0_9MARC
MAILGAAATWNNVAKFSCSDVLSGSSSCNMRKSVAVSSSLCIRWKLLAELRLSSVSFFSQSTSDLQKSWIVSHPGARVLQRRVAAATLEERNVQTNDTGHADGDCELKGKSAADSEASTSGSGAQSKGSREDLNSFPSKVKEQKLMDVPIASPDSILETLVLISPFFLWGTAMVAMKPVLPKAGPMFVASWRLIPAGLLLIWFGASQGKKQPSGALAWISIALFGLVDGSCFQGFLAEGLKRTSAGLGSVIIDSQPLTVAVLAALLFGESLGFINYAGLALGIIGLLLLEVPLDSLENALKGAADGSGFAGLIGGTSFLNDFASWDRGEWRMLLAAQSMALGTVMVRWVCQYSDPFMATGWHMILGGIPLLILSFLQQDPALTGHIQDLNSADWLALLYTSVAGSAISYGVFFYNATRGSLTKLSSLTFLTPMFAALFGFMFLNEILTPVQLLGGVITLGGVLLVNYKPSSISEVDLEADEKQELP